MIDTARKQFPSNPDNWLYKDWDENTRVFSKVVYLGINDRGWSECTLAEREEYESRYPQPLPDPLLNNTLAE